MAAVAIFTCKQNSHPFQERHVQLSEPVKVGRSVARARPAPNNAIFDCKVLSRNHAILWYENGKFLLQDTKSSNGTFINNQRLSKGSEESPPREIYSGDIIQFGVDVMENSRKVTHGCIIASIQLFHPDGQEATGGPSSAFLTGGGGATLQSQELYQLAQYLQEALHREQMLENKLATLQRLVSSTQDASESGWQALIDEDRLLSRLEVLENQLQTYSKNHTEDTLRQELTALQEDKYNYETTAKESLRKMLQEKLDAVRKLSELERSLSNTEDECSHLKNMCETSQKELQQLADTHEEQLKEMKKLEEQLAEAERKHQVEYEIVEKEKKELQEKIDDMVKQEDILSAKVESLQADNDFTKEQLTNMKTKMEAIKEKHGDNQYIPEFESTGVQVELVNLLDLQLLQNSSKSNEDMDELDLKEQLRETQLNIESYKSQLKDSELRLKESKETVEKLQNQLEDAKLECVSHLAKFSSLEERLSLSDVQLNQAAENTIADLKTQLNESRKQSDNSGQLATELKDQVVHLEKALCIYNTDTDRLNQQISCDATDVANSNSISNHIASNLSTNQLKEEIDKLKELLQEARESQKKSESEVDRCKRELDDATLRAKKASEEALALSNQLLDTQRKSKDKTDQNTTLQDQLNKAESTTKEVKEQILALREQLQDAQQTAKQSRNEAEQLRTRLQVLQEEFEAQKSLASGDSNGWGVNRTDEDKGVERAANVTTPPPPTGIDFSALREECSNLRRRIQDIEVEMKASRKDNHQLQIDYTKLQDSYKELEALKDQLKDQEITWKINLTDAQKDSEQTKRELTDANDEIVRLNEKISEYKEEMAQMKQQLDDMDEEYQLLAYKSKTLSTCSMIPVLILLFGVMLAMYPTLSAITATSTLT